MKLRWHRCRYNIPRPGCIRVRSWGLLPEVLLPVVKWYCRCGAEEPVGAAFFDAVTKLVGQ